MKMSDCRKYEINLAVIVIILAVFILVDQMKHEADKGPHTVNLSAILHIESSNCKNLFGADGEVGCFQITQLALIDVNEYLNTDNPYTTTDLLDYNKSREIADVYINKVIPRYFERLSIPDSAEHRIIAYNRGIRRFKEWYRSGAVDAALPEYTRRYLKKYRKFDEVNV